MPATNEEFIKKAFESGLSESQVRAAVAERNQRSQQPVEKEPGLLGKILKNPVVDYTLNAPSYAVGGMLKRSTDEGIQAYNPLKNPFGIPAAIEGLRDKTPVMEELPRALGKDPDSGKGMAIGLIGELLTPDAGDFALASKVGRKTVDKISAPIANMFRGVGEQVAESGIKVNPGQARKFEKATKKTVGKYIADEDLAGNVAANVAKRIEDLQGQYDDIALNSGIVVKSDDFGGAVSRSIAKLDDIIEEDEIGSLQEFAQKLGRKIKSSDGGYDLAELVKKRRLLDDRIPESQWARLFGGQKVSNDVKKRMLLAELINESASQVVSSAGLTLKEIGKQLMPLYKLEDIVSQQSFLGRGAKLFGLTGLLGAGVGASVSGGSFEDRLKGAAGGFLLNKAFSNPKLLSTTSKALTKAGEKTPKTIEAMLRLAKELGLQVTR